MNKPRTSTLLLALLLCWPLLAPAVLAVGSSVPHACCLRGQHHCGAMWQSRPAGAIIHAGSRCECCTCVLGISHSPAMTPVAAAPRGQTVEALVSSAKFSAALRFSAQSLSVRAPPAFLA